MIAGDVKMLIWSKVNRDSLFQTEHPAVRRAWTPFIRSMPDILDEAKLLERPVSALNIVRARNVFWRYCHVNGCAEALSNAIPDEELLNMDITLYRNMIYHTYAGRILKAIWRAESLQHQITPPQGEAFPDFADRMLLFKRTIGLDDEGKRLVTAGNPLMEELLIVQPTIIFRLS